MTLQFPLDREASAAADDIILPKNGGKPLTMSNKDAALRKEWLKAYEDALKKGSAAGKKPKTNPD